MLNYYKLVERPGRRRDEGFYTEAFTCPKCDPKLKDPDIRGIQKDPGDCVAKYLLYKESIGGYGPCGLCGTVMKYIGIIYIPAKDEHPKHWFAKLLDKLTRH